MVVGCLPFYPFSSTHSHGYTANERICICTCISICIRIRTSVVVGTGKQGHPHPAARQPYSTFARSTPFYLDLRYITRISNCLSRPSLVAPFDSTSHCYCVLRIHCIHRFQAPTLAPLPQLRLLAASPPASYFPQSSCHYSTKFDPLLRPLNDEIDDFDQRGGKKQKTPVAVSTKEESQPDSIIAKFS